MPKGILISCVDAIQAIRKQSHGPACRQAGCFVPRKKKKIPTYRSRWGYEKYSQPLRSWATEVVMSVCRRSPPCACVFTLEACGIRVRYTCCRCAYPFWDTHIPVKSSATSPTATEFFHFSSSIIGCCTKN